MTSEGLTVVKRGRGRPKGTKNKPDARKTGPKAGQKRARQGETSEVVLTAGDIADVCFVREEINDLEDDEEAVLFQVQVTGKSAMEGPHAPKRMEGDSIEKVEVEGATTWEPLGDGDLLGDDEIIRLVVL